MEDHDSRKQAAFWEAYRGCAEENRVPPDRSQYYLRWVKEFVGFIPEKRLKARSGKDIEAFLAHLAGSEGIAEDWDLRILLRELVVGFVVEMKGFEPSTYALRTHRSPI